jgi:hypothetical protein
MMIRKYCRSLVLIFLSLLFLKINVYTEDLRNINNRADYIIITSSNNIKIAEALAEFRKTHNSFETMVVSIDSIKTQFSKTNQNTSPDTCLKNFIQYTLLNWTEPKPKYFLLAGNVNIVPSHMELESVIFTEIAHYDSLMIDQWFIEGTDENGKTKLLANIGRFPAWDSTSLATMINKTIGYELNEITESWWNKAIVLKDYNLEDGTVFENDAKSAQLKIFSIWSDTISVYIRDNSPNDFKDLWNEGTALITYFGHAGAYKLSRSSYFTIQDADSLSNENRLPVCLFGGCELVFHEDSTHSLPVRLLENKNGGSVAVVSSEGLMFESTTVSFINSMIQNIKANPDNCLGDVFTNSKSTESFMRRYTFLGDPAISIKHVVVAGIDEQIALIPNHFTLEQNYPNPFNSSTTITYELPNRCNVTLKIFDILGREVSTLVKDEKAAGKYSVRFDGNNLASGIYFYKLQTGTFSQTKKLMLMK